MSAVSTAVLMIAVAIGSWLATAAALRFLDRRAILDHPNERSSHRRPTPRGGGIALVPIVVLAWSIVALHTEAPPILWIVIIAGAALGLISWIDDVRDLPPAPRFLSHIAAVAAVLFSLPGDGLVFQGLLPPLLDRLTTGLLWVWFINLYNFMDGIDGITGVETMAIGTGTAAIACLGAAVGGASPPLGLVLAAAAAGFLRWNWHPARIFMGDVGSVPIGFFAGWLLIAAAISGAWAAALILPAYHLADATITLVRRAGRLEPIWKAHREHFYQKAVAAGRSHSGVTLTIGCLNLVLIAAAVGSRAYPGTALVVAIIVTMAVLLAFSRPLRPR